jgi:8-oxo-dGTP pyrophosphatase MutT (NUDIX family)
MMARRAVEIGPTGRRLAGNIRTLREAHRLNQPQLAERMRNAGRFMHASGISKIEQLDRRVDVDDLIGLAIALGVTPDRLLLTGRITPDIADQAIELTSAVQMPVLDAWQWAVGDTPLFGSDVDVSDFRRENRPHERPDHRVDMAELRKHPELVRQAAALVRAARAEGVGLALLRDFVELATLTAVNGQDTAQQEPARPPAARAVQPIVAAIVTSELGVLVGSRVDRKPPWTFIAGENEPDESPADTIIREVKEETGLEIEADEIIGERDHPATGRHMIYMAGHPVRGTRVITGDEAELDDVRWVDFHEALGLMPDMFEPVRTYLENALAGDE